MINDSHHLIRPIGAAQNGTKSVDRARPGSKQHVITDAHWTLLAVSLTGENRHNVIKDGVTSDLLLPHWRRRTSTPSCVACRCEPRKLFTGPAAPSHVRPWHAALRERTDLRLQQDAMRWRMEDGFAVGDAKFGSLISTCWCGRSGGDAATPRSLQKRRDDRAG